MFDIDKTDRHMLASSSERRLKNARLLIIILFWWQVTNLLKTAGGPTSNSRSSHLTDHAEMGHLMMDLKSYAKTVALAHRHSLLRRRAKTLWIPSAVNKGTFNFKLYLFIYYDSFLKSNLDEYIANVSSENRKPLF